MIWTKRSILGLEKREQGWRSDGINTGHPSARGQRPVREGIGFISTPLWSC